MSQHASDERLSDSIAGIVRDLISGATAEFSKNLTRLRLSLPTAFAEFVVKGQERTRQVKILLRGDDPINVEDIYVPLNYSSNQQVLSARTLEKLCFSSGRVVVSGSAGSGKSIFLKHLGSIACANSTPLIPLFFELRQLNSLTQIDLISALRAQILPYVKELSDEIFKELLSSGRFVILLDGYDEVNFDIRSKLSLQIAEISLKFPECSIVITTRPDEYLERTSEFRVFRCQPMTLEQLRRLIELVPYSDDIKKPFLRNLNSSFSKHQSFIANPLLATMMLMTYGEYAEIPEKIHVFYDWAFNVLFRRHDANKGMFVRKMYSGLQIDDFSKIIHCFSAKTYLNEMFSFSDLAACEHIKAALDYESINCNPDDFFRDMHESVSLLQRDGLNYVFAHRSFQEYFTAKFLNSLDENNLRLALDAIVQRRRSDAVPELLKAVDVGKFERAWALPTLEELITAIEKIDATKKPSTYLRIFYDRWVFIDEGIGVMGDSRKRLSSKHQAILNLYPYKLSRLSSSAEKARIRRRVDETISRGGKTLEDLIDVVGVQNIDKIKNLDYSTTDSRSRFLTQLPDSVAHTLLLDRWTSAEASHLRELHAAMKQRVRSRISPFLIPSKRPKS